jgi:hypothetical protein
MISTIASLGYLLLLYLIIKRDPRGLLRHVYVFVKCSIGVVALLFHCSAKFHQCFGDRLVGRF